MVSILNKVAALISLFGVVQMDQRSERIGRGRPQKQATTQRGSKSERSGGSQGRVKPVDSCGDKAKLSNGLRNSCRGLTTKQTRKRPDILQREKTQHSMPWKRFAKSMGASSRRKESNYKVRREYTTWERFTQRVARLWPASRSGTSYLFPPLCWTATGYSSDPMNHSVLSQTRGSTRGRWIDYLIPVEFSAFRPHRTTEPLTLSWSSSSERILTFRLLFPVPCWGFLQSLKHRFTEPVATVLDQGLYTWTDISTKATRFVLQFTPNL